MAVDIRGFGLIPQQSQDVAGALGRGLATQAAFQQMGQRNIAAEREAQVRQALSGVRTPEFQPQTEQQQMMAEQTAGLGSALAQAEQPLPVMTQEEKIQAAQNIDPATANTILKQMGLDDASKRAEMSRFATDLENTPFDMRRAKIEERVQKLRAEGRDATQTEKLLDMNEAQQNQGLTGIQLMDLSTKERFGVKERMAAAGPKIGTFNPRDYTPKSFAEFRETNDPSVLVRFSEKAVNIGGVPHRLTTEGIYEPIKSVETVASNKAKITAAVKQAESTAKGRGETLDEYNKALAALPELQATADKLMTLSDAATYTRAGKAFNFMAKELGFSATKGATARAQMQSIVDNQVLPLLKQTFGAAFTENEGNRLSSTLMDIDASPEEKKATLKSFIEQKVASLRTQERELGIDQPAQPATQQPAQNVTPTGRTATNPQTSEKAQEMSDGTWRVM